VGNALLRKGMTQDETHHEMYEKSVRVGEWNVILQTRISHGRSSITDKLVGAMAKQCALRKQDFLALVECSLDEAGWDRRVRHACPDGYNPYVAPARELPRRASVGDAKLQPAPQAARPKRRSRPKA
jgi:hypothetical protein